MENHQRLVQNLCRICGNSIKKNPSYVNPKCVDNYKTSLDCHYLLNVENEPHKRYPKLLCQGCKRSVKRQTRRIKYHQSSNF